MKVRAGARNTSVSWSSAAVYSLSVASCSAAQWSTITTEKHSWSRVQDLRLGFTFTANNSDCPWVDQSKTRDQTETREDLTGGLRQTDQIQERLDQDWRLRLRNNNKTNLQQWVKKVNESELSVCVYIIWLKINNPCPCPTVTSDLQVSDDAVGLRSIQTTGWWGWELSSSTHHQVTQLWITGCTGTLVLEVLEVLEPSHWKKNCRDRDGSERF